MKLLIKPFLAIIIYLITVTSSVFGQKLMVINATYDSKDLYASTHQVLDKKGRPCALLRISIPSIKDVSFSKEVVQVSYEGGEYSVFVPAGTKQFSLSHPNYELLKIRTKDYNLKIEQKCVYLISIAPEESVNQITDIGKKKKQQYVSIHVSPSSATITINGEKLTPKRGQVTKLLPSGNYAYTVSAKDYHEVKGSFSTQPSSNLVAFDVKLKPTFGWLSLNCSTDFESAETYIDGTLVGRLPIWRTDRINSGTHQLKIIKDFYKPYEQTVKVEDGKVYKSNIVLDK